MIEAAGFLSDNTFLLNFQAMLIKSQGGGVFSILISVPQRCIDGREGVRMTPLPYLQQILLYNRKLKILICAVTNCNFLEIFYKVE